METKATSDKIHADLPSNNNITNFFPNCSFNDNLHYYIERATL